jgi:hypothetical protein
VGILEAHGLVQICAQIHTTPIQITEHIN